MKIRLLKYVFTLSMSLIKTEHTDFTRKLYKQLLTQYTANF